MIRIRSALIAAAALTGAVSIASADSYVATVEVVEFGTALTLTVDLDASEVEIRSVGPADRYFAWGFGATSMSDTYALITNEDGNESLTERKLGNHSAGDLLDPSLVVDSSSIDAGTLTVLATRPLAAAGPDYFEFTLAMIENGTPFDMIWSQGSSTGFSYHGNSNRASGSATFDKSVSSVPGDEQDIQVVGTSWGELKVRFEKVER